MPMFEKLRSLILCGLLISLTTFGPAVAGGALDDLEYRYPCSTPANGPLDLVFGSREDAAVSLGFQYGRPYLNVNDRVAFDQPYIVVAFEYFAACEMAQELTAQDLSIAARDTAFAEDMLAEFDCRALDMLFRLGVARSYGDANQLLDFLDYRKGEDRYLQVPFWRLAENIDRLCPP